MKPIASDEIRKVVETTRKKSKLAVPVEDPRLASRAAELAKLRAEANGLADRIERLRAAQTSLQRALRDRDIEAQLKAEREIAAVGAPVGKLTDSLLALASRIRGLEAAQEAAYAEVTAESASAWWESVESLKARSTDLVREAAVFAHAAAAISHERATAFQPSAAGVDTPASWRRTLRDLGHATAAQR